MVELGISSIDITRDFFQKEDQTSKSLLFCPHRQNKQADCIERCLNGSRG
jgi:hypothetical protein